MSLIGRKEAKYWHNLLMRVWITALTVAIIVWFLPRDSNSKRYNYDVGKPWMYQSFIAQFDFPIYKSEDAIKQEQDSILKGLMPYYNYDPTREKKELERFNKDFSSELTGLSHHYRAIIIDRIHRLYSAGIMNTPEYNAIAHDSTNMVKVVAGKSATPIEIGCIYSTMSAYEALLKDEELSKDRALLQKLNLTNYLEPNLTYDKEKTETERTDMLGSIPLASGMVLSGQKIIDRGEIVDDYTYRVLSSFERELQRRNATQMELTTTFIGQVIYVTILVMLFTMYIALFRKDYFDKPRSIMMLYVMITLFPIAVAMMIEHNWFNVYIVPFAMAAIFARMFMDSRTAFVTQLTIVLICAAAVKYQYEFIIIQIVSGLVAIYSLRELSSRAQVIKTAALVTVSCCAVYLALQMMQETDVLKLDSKMYTHFAVNGVLLLLSYPLMYLIEKTFGFTSNVTLFELSNTFKGVLRNLSEVAPGTFQHSITVGNLAAEVANRIGADSLLVRVGALYHDIGKMTNPAFFTENQAGVNPHDALTCKESAKIIIGHVTEGVKIAEKANLPTIIKDFILTHHGRGMAKYFYIKYQNEHPDEVVDKEQFTYPGPNPFTREQALLMMADTCEAASRSLQEYTEESISSLVDRLIDSQVADGCFKDCPITFRDIAQAKQVLTERLMSIYHTRIQYPELKKE
ncbi:hD phosphohydrolase family protein [Prevotella sp. CAG:1092]|nr:HDIG domain-containing protein [Prevotella sp.]MDY4150790.1 HDIG domain-containing protein [Prevotella sp.]CCZ11140.1 hD phosphohydrolase family protein [Prevotella sp. CAG:1092]